MTYKLVLFFFRGGTFRGVFDHLGELRSLIPSRVNLMALTATATKTLRHQVCVVLGMVEYDLDKPNVYLECQELQSIAETLLPVADELKKQRTSMPRTIIFCKKRVICSQIYSFFRYYLREEFTKPPGKNESSPKFRYTPRCQRKKSY